MNRRQTWCLERFALERRSIVLPDVVLLTSPTDHRRNTRRRRHHPDDCHVDSGPAGRPLVTVPDRKHGSREPVSGNHTEVPDRRRTIQNVHDQPRIASNTTEDPSSQALVGGRQG